MRPRAPLSALVAFSALAGCGPSEDPVPTVTVGRQVFLLNRDRASIAVDGRTGHDFTSPRGELPVIGEVRAAGRALRALTQAPGSEVSFPGVLPRAGELVFEVAFTEAAVGAPRPFSLEALSRDGAGREQVFWREELLPPASQGERSWRPFRVALTPPAERAERDLDLVLRVRGASGARAARGPLPSWGNPRLVGPGRAVPAMDGSHRNVVVFLIDTLRADHVGAYGYGRPTTPAFDRLAESGTLFLHATAPSSWTKASVASLFTSRLPSRHGAEDYPHRLPDSEVTLAEVFRSAGYRTGAVGANRWIFYPHFDFDGGFEDFLHVFDAEGTRGATADAVVDEAIDWVEQHRREPFFLYVHVLDPHSPYDPPGGPGPFLEEPYEGTLEPSSRGPGAFVRRDPAELEPADMAYLRALYDAEIAFADRHMGRLVDALRALGLWEETTFVALSDHGEEFGEHGGWEHSTTLYEEQTRVPLLVVPPASIGRAGRRVAAPVSLVDVAPTVCELAGVPFDGVPFDGRSLAGGAPEPDLVASELNLQDRRLWSLTDGALKVIARTRPEPRQEVYRLDADPAEQRDLGGALDAATLAPFRERLAELWRGAVPEGIYVELAVPAGSSAAVAARGTLRSDRPLRDLNPLGTEYSVDGARMEGDRAFFGGDARRVVVFELEVGPGDERDFFHLRAPPGATLTLEADFAGALPALRIGPGGERAPDGPFEIAADDPRLAAAGIPPPPDEPVLRLFRLAREADELDADEKEALRELGYW